MVFQSRIHEIAPSASQQFDATKLIAPAATRSRATDRV